MSALKEFANFILLNVANLAATYDRLLSQEDGDYAAFPADSRTTRARRLIKTVAEACEVETPDPLRCLFEEQLNTPPVASSPAKLPHSLVEIECLGQTLTPVVTNLEAGKFLWQTLAEVRATVFNSFSFDSTPVSNLAAQPELPQDNDKAANQAPEVSSLQQQSLVSTLIDNLPDYVYAKDAESRFILLNKATAHLLGVSSPDEVVGKTDFDFFPPELARQFRADEQALMQSGQSLLNHEERLVDSTTGQTRWNLTSKIPLQDDKGKIIGLIGINRDITQRKQAEEQSRKLFRAVEQSVNTIVITDTSGYIEYVNPKFAKTTGYTREEALGQHTRILKSGVTSPEEYKRLWETIRAGGEWQGEFCNKKKDGELYWEFASISPIKDENGVVTHFLAVKEDITARKQAEEALRESEERSAAIVRQAADGVVIVQANELKFLNQAMADMLGYLPDEMINTSLINYIAPESRSLVAARIKARLAGEDVPAIYEAKLLRKDGTIIDAELSAGVIKYRGEDADLGLIRNITARKQAEAAVRESQQRFQGLVETLSDWIWEVDQNGTYTYVSPKVTDLLGYEPEEVLGKTPFDFMPPEEAQRVVGVFGPLLAAQQPLVALENINQHKDGHLVVFETSGLPFFDADGQFKGYRGTDRDITRRKQMEEQIQQSLARLTRQIQAITEVAQQVAGTLTMNDLFHQVVDLMQTQFGYYHAQIYTMVEGDMVLQAGTGETGRQLKEMGHQISLSTEQSLVVRAVWEGSPVLVPDVTQEPSWLPNPLLPETRAELAVPITLGVEIFGVLDVQSDKVDGLNVEDQLLLVGLCGQIAIAIETRRTEAERSRLLAEVERRAHREQTIREITERMRAANNLEQLVKITARELGQRLAAGHVVVELGLEPDTQSPAPAKTLSNNGH
ncbi:MAG: PAS domain S-box protein [Anaerolineae bacterium]|nr:PAS domain S-box protein [Anaerolineae bacterium]